MRAYFMSLLFKRFFFSTYRSVEFNYPLLRQIVEEAGNRTNLRLASNKISVILPYGFEFLDKKQSLYPNRHFPVIGYPLGWSYERAECVAHIFQELLIELISQKFLSFYHRLRYIEIINENKVYSRLLPATISLDEMNTMYIKLVPLSSLYDHVLDHYIEYVACLFASILLGNYLLPEAWEFEGSKDCRNQFFREYLIFEAIASKLVPKFPRMTKKEKRLFAELLQQIQIQSIPELIHETTTKNIAMIEIEKIIHDQLIYPRIERIRQIMAEQGLYQSDDKIINVKANSYYNNNWYLCMSVREKDLNKIKQTVKKAYYDFPRKTQRKFFRQKLAISCY